jgi:hypothetical protein
MLNRPQTALTANRSSATQAPVLGMLGAGTGKAGLGSPQHRKTLSSYADTAALSGLASHGLQGSVKGAEGGDAGGHLRPHSAAPAHNKRLLFSPSFSGKAPLSPGSPSQLSSHLASQRSSSPSLPRTGTAHATGGLPLERRPSGTSSGGSSSSSNRSSAVPGAGVGDWLNPPLENDGPLEREALQRQPTEGPAAAAVAAVGARQRPCTAGAAGFIRRLRPTADSDSTEEGGISTEEGDLVAVRRELEHARGEVARISNERDLLRATLMQATRDKPGLMKLGHPVSLAKKDSRLAPAASSPKTPLPPACGECDAHEARVKELQEELADANRRCADLAKQVARAEVKGEVKAAGVEGCSAEQLKRALADVKAKQKRVTELEGQLHSLQQQHKGLLGDLQTQRKLAREAAAAAEADREAAAAAAAAVEGVCMRACERAQLRVCVRAYVAGACMCARLLTARLLLLLSSSSPPIHPPPVIPSRERRQPQLKATKRSGECGRGRRGRGRRRRGCGRRMKKRWWSCDNGARTWSTN